MRAAIIIGLLFSLVGYCGCEATPDDYPPLAVVDHVDLDKFAGTWHEVAHYPFRSQTGCVSATAEFRLEADGTIGVYNSYRQGSRRGEVKEFAGSAQVLDPGTNAQWKVDVDWPDKGYCWIVEMDPQYEWVVIGQPSRERLWILGRTPLLKRSTYATILATLPEHGFDPVLIERTAQPDFFDPGDGWH